MRGGMYWSGDLAYRDADGFVYFAGRTADWLRVDGENLAAAPIERILLRHPAVDEAAVYAVPGPVGRRPGDGGARRARARSSPADLEAFLAAQPDLSRKGWPAYVRVVDTLPRTATNKVLKRELAGRGPGRRRRRAVDPGAARARRTPERLRSARARAPRPRSVNGVPPPKASETARRVEHAVRRGGGRRARCAARRAGPAPAEATTTRLPRRLARSVAGSAVSSTDGKDSRSAGDRPTGPAERRPVGEVEGDDAGRADDPQQVRGEGRRSPAIPAPARRRRRRPRPARRSRHAARRPRSGRRRRAP